MGRYRGLTLRVLAGSELADLAPVLERAAQATGVKVAFDFTGTLAGADQVIKSADTDAAILGVRRAVIEGRIPMERLDRSVGRWAVRNC